MDSFEQVMHSINQMSPEELKVEIRRISLLCTCGNCPSYTRCAGNSQEMLFCATGKSFTCISDEKGCICQECPVTSGLGLKYISYCTRGSENAQRCENVFIRTRGA